MEFYKKKNKEKKTQSNKYRFYIGLYLNDLNSNNDFSFFKQFNYTDHYINSKVIDLFEKHYKKILDSFTKSFDYNLYDNYLYRKGFNKS